MDVEARFSVSAQAPDSRLGTELAPVVVNVRRSPAFEADDTVIARAIRCLRLRRPPRLLLRLSRPVKRFEPSTDRDAGLGRKP